MEGLSGGVWIWEDYSILHLYRLFDVLLNYYFEFLIFPCWLQWRSVVIKYSGSRTVHYSTILLLDLGVMELAWDLYLYLSNNLFHLKNSC